MKTQELEDKLKNVEVPVIEIEGHRSRLKMELLNSDYFKQTRRQTIMDTARVRSRSYLETILGGLTASRPAWKVAIVTGLAIILTAGMVFGIGSLTGTKQAGFYPNGYTTYGGTRLTEAEEALAVDIMKADSRVQEILASGATIDVILPLYVIGGRVNPETGELEEFEETWAQAWLSNLDGSTWGIQVNLVMERVEQITSE